MSFCVYDSGIRKDDHWALTFQSVIVVGKVSVVEDYDFGMEIIRRMSRCFTTDEVYIEHEIRQAGKRTLIFALTPEHITGKIVVEE